MVLSGDSMVNWAPYAAAVALPYAMKNGYDDVVKALSRPDIGGVIEKDIVENVKLKPLGYFLRSARNLTANRKVEKYSDLKGLKMRIANNPLHQKLWTAFGASANPMNWSEVFSALQNGTIEAQENPYAQIISANIYEAQKYLIQTEHIYTWIYVLIGVDIWNNLSPDHQKAIQEAADIMTKFQHDYHKNEVKDQETFLKSKMQFITIDKTPFIETSKKVLKEELSPELYAIYEKMLNL
jgi:TRAP-type C4-dicarboxylate transport system substrate-binding protein